MKKLKLTQLLSILMLSGLQADARLINVNFTFGGPNQSGAAVLGSAGDQWNNIAAPISSVPLFDSTGHTVSNLTLTVAAWGGGPAPLGFLDAGGTAMDSGTTPLMEQYLYESGGNDMRLTISGLSAYAGDSFTLVIYSAGDVVNQGTGFYEISGATNLITCFARGESRQISAGDEVAYSSITSVLDGNDLVLQCGTGTLYVILNGFQLYIVPPPLNIAPGANQVALYWTGVGNGFRVETATNLSSTNWVTVTNANPIVGLMVTNASPAAFFRLAP
jgi:hypothetical protein